LYERLVVFDEPLPANELQFDNHMISEQENLAGMSRLHCLSLRQRACTGGFGKACLRATATVKQIIHEVSAIIIFFFLDEEIWVASLLF